MNNIELLRQKLNSEDGIVIKLIGDSITQGVGGTGFCQDGEHIVDKFDKDTSCLKNKKLFLLDMDGTIYNENTLFEGTIDFLRLIEENGGKINECT